MLQSDNVKNSCKEEEKCEKVNAKNINMKVLAQVRWMAGVRTLGGRGRGVDSLQHSLVEDRVATSLADHQVGPLHHHDRREEGGVAGELQHLALGVRLRIATKKNRYHSSKKQSHQEFDIVQRLQ